MGHMSEDPTLPPPALVPPGPGLVHPGCEWSRAQGRTDRRLKWDLDWESQSASAPSHQFSVNKNKM